MSVLIDKKNNTVNISPTSCGFKRQKRSAMDEGAWPADSLSPTTKYVRQLKRTAWTGNSDFCTKAIRSMLKSSRPVSATLTVWQITLGVSASCGLGRPNAHRWHPVPDNGISMPTVGRRARHATRPPSAVSSFLHSASGFSRQNASPR